MVRTFVDVPYFLAVIPYAHHITVDILGLSGPICLLITRYKYQKIWSRTQLSANLRDPATSRCFMGELVEFTMKMKCDYSFDVIKHQHQRPSSGAE